ncbi:hypothetical protein [Winogradskyella schleiferi]|uniref:hypothetical protein n=1 Tax=Winogradskyella schleiferi TaxID=2686078 RepID=UPI0015C1B2A3|nr:hypothetical protein [Winogradskyella schleiferi]
MDKITVILIIFIGLGSAAGVILTVKKLLNTEKNKNDIIDSQRNEISTLNNDLNLVNKELQLKQIELKAKSDSIENLTKDVLNFSKDIDFNTKTIEGLTNEISNITKSTNIVSGIIKNEQRQKGILKLKKSKFKKFEIVYGNNMFLEKSLTELEKGIELGDNMLKIKNFSKEFKFSVKFSGDDILISGILHEKNGTRVIELKDGEWALNKASVFSINYDDTAIEIIDNDGYVLLQIEVIKNKIYFKGIFYSNTMAVVFNDGIQSVSLDSEDFEQNLKSKVSTITRIFKHTGENYLGVRNPEVVRERKKRIEIINEELLQNYNELSNLILIDITSKFVNKYSLLFNNTRNEMINLIKQNNMSKADIVHEKMMTEYESSIRAEAIKLRNTLLKRIPEDRLKRIRDQNPMSMTLENYINPNGNPEIGGVIEDINIMLQLLKAE